MKSLARWTTFRIKPFGWLPWEETLMKTLDEINRLIAATKAELADLES